MRVKSSSPAVKQNLLQPSPIVIGVLSKDERKLFRDLTVALRKAQRAAQRAQSLVDDALDGFKESHPDVHWKEATGIDDFTGEVQGKREPPKVEKE
jgi:hypothetical protein